MFGKNERKQEREEKIEGKKKNKEKILLFHEVIWYPKEERS